jgi:uncharacterized cupredoxin-like copper-binding protein
MSQFVSSRAVEAALAAKTGSPAPRSLSRLLTGGTSSRRQLLQFAAVGGLGSVVLAACGGNNEVGLADEEVTRIANVPGAPPPPAQETGSPAAGAAGASGEAAAPAAGGEITIEGYDIGWRYNGQETAPGAPIDVPAAPGATINLHNVGAAAHNFVVETLDNVVVDMPIGETVTYTVPADAAPGTYEFICNIPGHAPAGMVGNLIVDPNAAPAAPAAAGEQPAPASGQAAAPAGGEVTIEGFDIGWRFNGQSTAPGAPIDVPVSPGATINLLNAGAAAHNFVVETLDNVVVDMPIGETVTYTVPADAAPGTYEFICNIPGHAPAGMVGNLVIQ